MNRLDHLLAYVEFGSVDCLVDRERIDEKKHRVEKWMIYAEQVKNKEGQL